MVNHKTIESAGSGENSTIEIAELRQVALMSLLGGSTSLIPLPFVDDWALQWVRRRLIRQFAGHLLLRPREDEEILIRYGRLSAARSCLASAVMMILVMPVKITFYILKRLFKKVIFVLAIKEATDRASAVFHEGYLLAVAGRNQQLKSRLASQGEPAVLQFSYALLETIQQTDTSPIRVLLREAFQGSRWVLLQAARTLGRVVGRGGHSSGPAEETLRQEASILEAPVERLTALLQSHRAYLTSLEARFVSFAARRGLLDDG